jgi:hypothetical protein
MPTHGIANKYCRVLLDENKSFDIKKRWLCQLGHTDGQIS